ncbi:MAG: aspartate kinase [Bacteriovoracaceae bacterium]|nr:aspartate kinase [Bacteriovoracaceae bacterium]
MKLAVAKFGGTSMMDASIALKSAHVLGQRPEIRLCVISATAGTTNQLFTMARESAQHLPTAFEAFRDRHLRFIQELTNDKNAIEEVNKLCHRVQEILQGMKLLKETSLSALDDLVSHGELISSLLFVEALKKQGKKVKWVDARTIMKTTSDHGRALPLLDLLRQHAENEIKPHLHEFIVVTQGYIGSDMHGRTTTLGKEGSDYSTALLAEALDASEIQIWKDVAGVMTTDPRLVKEAHTLEEITFQEISELTRFGAKVIHPDTFLPAIRAQIPVYVGYSQDPNLRGTKVVLKSAHHPPVRAIALKREQKWLTIKEPEGFNHPAFILNVMQTLNKYKIIPTLINTSENRMGMVIDKIYTLTADCLRELAQWGETHIHEGEVLSIVGLGISAKSEIQSMALRHLNGAHPYMVSCGASENSICLMVATGLGENILKSLHHTLLEKA